MKSRHICAVLVSIAFLTVPPAGADEVTASAQAKIAEVVRTVMKEVNAHGRAQAATQGPASQAADLATLQSVDEISGRIKTLHRYRDALNDMIGILVAAPARAMLQARNRGLGMAAAQQAFVATKQAMAEGSAPVLIAKLQADRDWVNAVVSGYQVLGANRDSWRPNTQSDNPPIIIRDRAFVDVFLEVIDQIAAAEERANAASDAVERARRGG